MLFVRYPSAALCILALLAPSCLHSQTAPAHFTPEPHGTDSPIIAKKSADTPDFSWYREIVSRIPPMKVDRGAVPPMITWEGFGYDPLTAEQYRELLARGFAQNLHLDEKLIPAALAMQAAGSPVILMQGGGGAFPSDQAGDTSVWTHQFEAGYKPTEGARPCLSITLGWAKEADHIRGTLRRFKEAGVTVNGVWMDWEGDPLYGKDRYDQAIHCTRCRALLPARALANRAAFEAFCRRRFVELIGAYLAAPVLEIFPGCSVTNWNAMVSTPDRKLTDWDYDVIDPSMPAFFTHTNPSAYGDTTWWRLWKPEYRNDQEHVDRFWMYQLIRQPSDEAVNRLKWMPEKTTLPWVARWLPEHDKYQLPVMSRSRYRELLRHLWLRGATGMQVFNPKFKGYEQMAVFEVEDAAAVYREMMAFHELIEKGEPINLKYPGVQDAAPLWSGLRNGNRAVFRVFSPTQGKTDVTVTVWPDVILKVKADSSGATYTVERNGAAIKVSKPK